MRTFLFFINGLFEGQKLAVRIFNIKIISAIALVIMVKLIVQIIDLELRINAE
jgi:hypothetical protein|tara:strand:+ start:180 stop:338 length:159 start_codon:yes stop_codon:yes gene_type:complete